MVKECRLTRLLDKYLPGTGTIQTPSSGSRGTTQGLMFVLGRWLWLSWPWWVAAGLILVVFLPRLYLFEWACTLAVLVTGYLLIRPLRSLALVLILFVLGALWGTLYGQHTLNAGLPEALIGQEVMVTGRVVGIPRVRERSQRFEFDVESLQHQSNHYPYRGIVMLSWYKPYKELVPGQRWMMKVKLKPAHGSLNPGGFDYQQWLFSRGIRATGYVRGMEHISLADGSINAGVINKIRLSIQKFIDAQALSFPGLITALSVGIRNQVSERQWQVFRDTGTAHLMAISGLHIGMVAAIVYLIAAFLWRYGLLTATQYPAQYVGRYTALIVAFSYAALAGFSIPSQRALLMVMGYFLMQMLGRNPAGLFTLGLVLLVVLLLDPLAPLGAGLWLSFGAVAVIILALRPSSRELEAPVEEHSKTVVGMGLSWFGQWWRVQWAVFLGLAPLSLYFFQQTSLVALLANFIAIPLVAFIVVPLILVALLGLVLGLSGVSAFLLAIADRLLGLLWPILSFLAELPIAILPTPKPELWAMVLAAGALILLFDKRLGKWRTVAILGLLPLFYAGQAKLGPAQFRIQVIDVGQGLAVLVRTQEHAVLYDAGIAYPQGFDAGRAIVLPFLRNQGIRQLDVIIASHDNLDHVGGFGAVLAEHPGALRYSSAAFYPVSKPCTHGTEWHWDGVQFQFLHPPVANANNDNNASCVLKVQSEFGSALLTGDIERAGEQRLLAEAADDLVNIDVLFAPHHGSKSSSLNSFLRVVNPSLAVISAGYLNRFKHPHPKIVDRYRAHGIAMMNTADSGWIELAFDHNMIRATPYRAIYKRYWHGAEKDESTPAVQVLARNNASTRPP